MPSDADIAPPRAARPLAGYIAGRVRLDSLESSRPVLQCVAERGPLSIGEIARACGLTQGTCSLHVQRLEHEGLIRREWAPPRGAGRPTALVGWNMPANATAAVVFSAPTAYAGLADFALRPLNRITGDVSGFRARRALAQFVRLTAGELRAVADGTGARIRQAVVCVPGLIDPATGIVRKAANIPLIEGVALADLISRALDAPCAVVPLGLAFYFGESDTLPRRANAMVINWDLGVGVVFGHGDRLLPFGADETEGVPTLPELGHLRIEKGGRACRCGQRGCLEAYVGGRSLLAELPGAAARGLNAFLERVRRREPAATRIARRAAFLLGRHLAAPAHAMRVGCVRICGPMAAGFDVLRADFCRGLGTLLTASEVGRLNPQASPPGEERFLLGAHRLALRLFSHPGDYAALLHTPRSLDERTR